MPNNINITINKSSKPNPSILDDFGLDVAKKTKRFHESFDQYEPTPLVELDNLAKEIGIGKVMVKDESFRFGLNAFKVLGGSYATGTYLAKRLSMDIDDLPYQKMISDEIREKLGDITFITATDGNHGRGIAWTVNKLKQKVVVYMPKGSVQYRLDQISALGAEATITDCHFDDTARIAFEDAEKNGWALIQDTTHDGYYEIPKLCMQGYTTMGYEAFQQMEAIGEKPTHIFIQAGAGSLAGGILGFFSSVYGEDRPFNTVVEAGICDCIRQTAEAADGKLHFISGDITTVMAGLSVGEPSSLGWDVLKDYADAFTSCSDSISAKGVRVLASPLGNDSKVVSGESGSVGVGLLVEVMTNPDFSDVKKKLNLDENSRVLFFNTEGDTDPENYKSIVWDGKFPSC